MIWVSRSTLLGAATIGVAGLIAVQWFGPEPADSPGGDTGAVALHDAVYGRDAQVQTGRLRDCSETGCRIEEHVFPRDAIAFVGLGVTSPIPPLVMDPTHDELHLRTGELVHEPLARIDGTRVFAGARMFERDTVAWIYLAPKQSEQEPHYQFDPEPERTGSLPEDPPPDSSSPPTAQPESGTPPPPPRPPSDDSIAACPDAQPLGAWIWRRSDYVDVISPNCIGSETQVVRFRLEPVPGTQTGKGGIALAYAAKELHYRVSTDGCFDVDQGIGQYICKSGAMFTEGTAAITAENLGVAAFMPLIPELTFQYPDYMQTKLKVTAHCVWDGSGPHAPPPPHDVIASLSWSVSISAKEACAASQGCENYCVAPTVCEQANYADPECGMHHERFAVIPFHGALVDVNRDARGQCILPGSSQVRWNVCCGCAETGPPPDFGIPKDKPCGPPQPQQALLDLALEQQKAILRPLGELLREQQRIQQQASQWQNDFQQATSDCRLWGVARFLVGTLAAGQAPGTASGLLQKSDTIPHIKEFWNFLAMAEKVNAGDPSWLLPNHEFKDWFSIEDVWDGFMIAYGGLGPSSPQSLREGLQQCGAPTTHGVLDGAYNYLRLIEQLPALADRMHGILNDVRAKDQEIYDLWQKYLAVCREYERCRGGDPSRCETPSQATASGTQD